MIRRLSHGRGLTVLSAMRARLERAAINRRGDTQKRRIASALRLLKYFRATLAHIRAYRDVLFWTGEEILDWYRAQHAQHLQS